MSVISRRFSGSPTVNVVAEAIQKAARSLAKDFREVEHLQVSQKGPGDFVSVADQRSEKILFKELQKAYPDDGFLMEESPEVKGTSGNRWIIDPLDGTTNFLHGIPHFCISVALEVKGQLTVGVVYDPLTDEFFWAERGRGAYLNTQRLRVSTRNKLDGSLLLCESPHFSHLKSDKSRDLFDKVTTKAAFRSFGSAALNLAYVAAGRAEAYLEYGLQPWDVAAGIVLVREAGGTVEGIGMRDNPETGESIMAVNEHLSGRLPELLGL